MNLGARLRKLQEIVRSKTAGPKVVFLQPGEDPETLYQALKAKYGQDYQPCLVVITEETCQKPA